jgi:hypothetical protein
MQMAGRRDERAHLSEIQIHATTLPDNHQLSNRPVQLFDSEAPPRCA